MERRLVAERLRQLAGLVAFVRAVHDERDLQIFDAEALQQIASWQRIVPLARRQAETEDLLEARGSQMNLAVDPVAAPFDGLNASVFRTLVPPLCALALVLSMLKTSIFTRRTFNRWSSSNTRSRAPALAHRLMRV